MSILIRLSYASNNPSKSEHSRYDFLKTLNEVCHHQFETPVYGVLYDFNGSIFHFIEGQKAHVDLLYRQLLHKTQQQQIKLLGYEQIDALSIDQLAAEHLITHDSIIEFMQQEQKLNCIITNKSCDQLSPPLLTHAVKQHKTFEEIQQILKEPFSPSLRCINSFFVFSTLFFALLLSYFLSTLSMLINQSFSQKKPELAAVN